MIFRRTPDLMASLRRAAMPASDPLAATQGVLWLALVIRKLSEAGEVSPGLQRRAWPARLHPPRPDAPPSSQQEWQGAYELAFSRQDWLTTLRLCGLLIHCYVFAATPDGVFFTSHVEKHDGLYFVEWDVLGHIVDAVCDEVPCRGVIRAA